MRFPAPPPSEDALQRMSPEQLRQAAAARVRDEQYLHWDDLRRRTAPEGLTREQWWWVLRWWRVALKKDIPLRNSVGEPFELAEPDLVLELLHKIDRGAAARANLREDIATPAVRDRYLISSLMEEAIASSQLEGAATTRVVAKEMLRTGRRPRTTDERMIANNFEAMRFLRERTRDPLTPAFVLELHSVLTEGTLEKEDAQGRLRRADEEVRVRDEKGEILHVPPPAEQLKDRMDAMCRFANEGIPSRFLHPAIRAILLHLWLAYDHPFVDGNGRTARALFYWSMLQQGYWLFEFLSISRLLRRGPAAYARSFLLVETDGFDATYFVLAQLRVIVQAIDNLWKYLERKAAETHEIERRLRTERAFNHRQLALLGHALRHPEARYTYESHRRSHGVVRQTARTDLLGLEQHGLLIAADEGKRRAFRPAPDLPKRLKA